jgi:hypothetical protein
VLQNLPELGFLIRKETIWQPGQSHMYGMADRYYALHDPIEHARRRTGGFVGIAIAVVWLVSCLICLPPLIGWNDWPGLSSGCYAGEFVS